MNTRLAALLIALALPALSGCGNKGPLVLPSEPALTEIPDTTTPAEDAAPTDTPPADAAPPEADAGMTPPVDPVAPTAPPAAGDDDSEDGSG